MFLDLDASIDKATQLIAEAARQGAKLILRARVFAIAGADSRLTPRAPCQ